MVVTIAATLCTLLNPVTTTDVLACHEEVLHRGDSLQECVLSQAAVADWKDKSRFRGPDWTITRIRCVPGAYVDKDAL